MTEMKQTVSDPVTKESFIQALKNLGITGNQILEVHSQMSSFGCVIGGARNNRRWLDGVVRKWRNNSYANTVS